MTQFALIESQSQKCVFSFPLLTIEYKEETNLTKINKSAKRGSYKASGFLWLVLGVKNAVLAILQQKCIFFYFAGPHFHWAVPDWPLGPQWGLLISSVGPCQLVTNCANLTSSPSPEKERGPLTDATCCELQGSPFHLEREEMQVSD